jgi:hypothetical protein
MISSLLSFMLGFFVLGASTATAVGSDALSGYMWSENIGWVSANCTNTASCGTGGGQSNFGATVSAGSPTRLISGYMWSENIGWVTFDESNMGNACPTGAGTCKAELNITTGEVSGWAQACAVFDSGCSGTYANSGLLGGWDGWIKLRDSNYGVLANGSKWTGFAWGGGGTDAGNATVGWVSFRGFTSNTPPAVYGINASSNAVGPQVISCGVNQPYQILNQPVTWTVVYDATKVTPAPTDPFTWTSLTSDVFAPAETDATQVMSYSTAGIKTAAVTMRTASGELYVVDCDGTSVNGVSPGYGSVHVANFNLIPSIPSMSSNSYEGVERTVGGQYDYVGPAITFLTPISSRFEFDRNNDGIVDETSSPPDHQDATFSNNESSVSALALWTPQSNGNSYRIRLCVDVANVLPETNESNCSGWSGTFEVKGPPPSGICSVTPRIVPISGVVTWHVTPSGGDGTYQYDWTFTGGATFTGGTDKSDQDPKVIYPTGGTKTATVRVQSDGEQTDVSCTTNGGATVRVQKFEEI